MEMPNGKSVDVGKADEVKELPIPEWARMAASVPASPPVANPLNMYAGSKMMGLGARKVAGKWTPPWRKGKVAEGALEVAQGRAMVYSPVGYGRSYS
jgi:hypothetical protein